jgi:hypothetical protein
VLFPAVLLRQAADITEVIMADIITMPTMAAFTQVSVLAWG